MSQATVTYSPTRTPVLSTGARIPVLDEPLADQDNLGQTATGGASLADLGAYFGGGIVPDLTPGTGFAVLAANTIALQAAVDAAVAAGGGEVACTVPGTYNFAAAGVDPYSPTTNTYVCDIGNEQTVPVTIVIAAGVTLQLGAGEQLGTTFGVNFFTFRNCSNLTFTINGTLSNNATGQSSWTRSPAYGQGSANFGSAICGIGTASNGNHHILVNGFGTVQQCFGCPVNIQNNASGNGSYITYRDFTALSNGEGPQADQATDVLFQNVIFRDPNNLCVGDAFEVSNCRTGRVRFIGCRVYGGGSNASAGAAIDYGGSSNVEILDFYAENFRGGFDNSSGLYDTDATTITDARLVGIFATNFTRRSDGAHASGTITLNNVQFEPPTGVTSIAATGLVTDGPLVLNNVRVKGHDTLALQMSQSSTVIATNFNCAGTSTNDIVLVANGVSDTQTLNISGGIFSGKIVPSVQSFGATFFPSGRLTKVKAVDINDGSTTNGTFKNLYIDPSCTVPARSGAVPVSGASLWEITGTITTVGAGNKDQILKVYVTSGTRQVNDRVANGSGDVNLIQQRAFTMAVGDSLWIQYNGTTWDEIARFTLGVGNVQNVTDGWSLLATAGLTNSAMTRNGVLGTIASRLYVYRKHMVTAVGIVSDAARVAETATVRLTQNGNAFTSYALDATNTTRLITLYQRAGAGGVQTATTAAPVYYNFDLTTTAGWLPITANIVAFIELTF